MTSKDVYYLFSGENREVCNIVIRQPKAGELIKCEIDVEEIIEPFFAFVDLCDMSSEQKKKYRNLDLLFHDYYICEREGHPEKSMLEAMVTTLKYLCVTDHVSYDLVKGTISVNGIEKITRDNFDTLQEYILSIFYAKKPKTQSIAGGDAQRKKVLEMQRRMAKYRKKNESTICDIMKVVLNADHLTYETILNYTYWQLMDRYSDILKIDAYNTHMAYKLSSKFDVKDSDRKHWSEDLRVNKN